MRRLIIDEVGSFRQLVRRHPAPRAQESGPAGHELPPAPQPPAAAGAGVGPAFSAPAQEVNQGADVEEHPGSALERQLQQRH